MNRRNFIKMVGLALASVFVKPGPPPGVIDLGEQSDIWIAKYKNSHFTTEIGNHSYQLDLDTIPDDWSPDKFYQDWKPLETGCGDPNNWTFPKHFFCVRWDATGVRYDVDSIGVTKEVFESYGVSFSPSGDEGTTLWWTT